VGGACGGISMASIPPISSAVVGGKRRGISLAGEDRESRKKK